MSEKDDLDKSLNQENSFDSNASNLPIKFKENKLKSLVEDLTDPMLSWRLKESFRDFTDSISMSGFGRTIKSAFNSVTGAISNFTNKIKENAEIKKYNDPSKTGINETTIETQESSLKNSIIMPQAPQQTAKKDPSTIIIAQAQTQPLQSKGIINNAKTAEDINLETTENSLKLEEMEIDKDAISKESAENVNEDQKETANKTVTSQIEIADINLGDQNKEDKQNDFEK